MIACFGHNQQHCCDCDYSTEFVGPSIVNELWSLQEIEEAHDYKISYANFPKWDAKNYAISADLVKKHFCQIHSINGV